MSRSLLLFTQLEQRTDDGWLRLGLAIFILVLLQATLGLIGHRTQRNRLTSSRPSYASYSFPPSRPSFPFVRLSHVVLGLVTIGLGYWQIETGISDDGEWQQKMSGSVPKAVQVIFWILVAVEVAAYVLAWAWHIGARVKKGPVKGAAARDGRASDESTLMDDMPPPVTAKPSRF